MCGFVGIVGREAERAPLEQALAAIRHRGPDGEGSWRGPEIALAHARLSIIDLSPQGAQPFQDERTGVVIVYNGEVYNHAELRAELDQRDFRSHSDTEVVLRLYLRDGIACLGKLRGMFALAIWDPRDRTLHLARDRFGIKPLHFARLGDGLAFGSEIKGLLALGVPARLDARTIRDYLADGRMAHGPQTFFAGIESLPPGHHASWRDGRLETMEFWSPEAFVTQGEDPAGDVEERVWELLKESVRQHLVSDVPIGLSLSSGTDSQLIAFLLSAVGQKEMHAFTFGYDDPAYDEVRRIEEVPFPLVVRRHAHRLRPDAMLETMTEAIGYFEAPLGGLGTLSAFALMELPRRENIKVLMSGEGSDEIFGGYKYYFHAYLRDLHERGDEARLLEEVAHHRRNTGEDLSPGGAAFTRHVLGTATMFAPDGTTLEGQGFLGPALKGLEPRGVVDGKAASHLRRAMLRDLSAQKLPKLLWYQDRAGMARGIEIRVPFLDHHVLEAVYRLPSHWQVGNGVLKVLPRRLLKRFCGVDYLGISKHYVATPQREWLKTALFEPVTSLLDGGVLAGSGLIDYSSFRTALASYAASPDLGNSFFAWKMINLELLLRRFFPGMTGDFLAR